MPKSRAFKYCPELHELFEQDVAQKSVFDCLVEEGFDDSFKRYLSGADKETLARFLDEVAGIDLERLSRHRQALLEREETKLSSADVEPMRKDGDQDEKKVVDVERGWAALREGHWAAVVFAGGAATRFQKEIGLLDEALPIKNEALKKDVFQFGDPKGCFPISPVMGRSFIEMIVAEALERSMRAGKLAPVLFMVSDVTEVPTEKHLAGDMWGFPSWGLIPFIQKMIPRLDNDGVLIAQPDGSLMMTGSGHGGVYAAMLDAEEGQLVSRLQDWGIANICMGNVDNLLLKPFHAARLGYHERKGAHFTLTATERSDAKEKVGVVVKMRQAGNVEVIEYSVMEEDVAEALADDGSFLFNAGNVNTLLARLDSIRPDIPETLYTDKPVKVGGKDVASSTSEALSQRLCTLLDPERVHVFFVDRSDLFLPTKNMVGKDSVEHSFKTLIEQTSERLELLGAEIASGAKSPEAYVEISPCLGLHDEDLLQRGLAKGWRLEKGSRLYLGVRYDKEGYCRPFSEGLHLEEDAQLLINAKRPYGNIKADLQSRAIEPDIASASKASIGKDVCIARGVRLSVTIEAGGSFEISAEARIEESADILVKSGEDVVL